MVRSCKASQTPVYPLVGVELGYVFGGSWGLRALSLVATDRSTH